MYIQILIESFLLVVALSVDAFVASLAYGTNKIKIPLLSVITLSAVCSGVLAVSLFFGIAVSELIPPVIAKIFCAGILFVLGMVKLFDSSIKAYVRKRRQINKKISFTFLHLNFILNIYANPEEADTDCSRILSPAEAVMLALALSIDGLAVGFGAALVEVHFLMVTVMSFVTGILAVFLGCFGGNKISDRMNIDLSWLSGVMLIILAILKL